MPKAHIAEWKKEKVKNLKNDIKNYNVIGIVNLENLPTLQLQRMKQKLKGKLNLVVTKKNLIRKAIEESENSKKNIKELNQHLKGMSALLLTNEEPFKIYKTIKQNKSKAPAKPGQIANQDITIEPGPTPFPPGPIIGELSQIGLQASVEQGKVTIKKGGVVVKEGQKIKPEVAAILSRLGIEPMEVGIDLLATYSNNEILTKNILDINEEEYINNIKIANLYANHLAIQTGYTTKDTIKLLITKAFNNAKHISTSQNILTDLTAKNLFGKTQTEVDVSSSKLNLEIQEIKEKTEELKEEKAEIQETEQLKIAEEIKEEKQIKEIFKKEEKSETERKPRDITKYKDALDVKKEKSKITPEKILKEIKKEEKDEKDKPIKKVNVKEILPE